MAFCPNCGAQVQAGVKFCPECGQSISQDAPAPTSPTAPPEQTAPPPTTPTTSEKPRKKKRRWLWAILGAVGLLFLCVVVVLVMPPSDDADEASATSAPLSTKTPGPTSAPTSTPTPAPLTARDVELKRDDLTDLQWENYKSELVGEEIAFTGEVLEVYDDARVQISFADTKRMMTGGMLYNIPTDEAIKLQKGDVVKGKGTIREITTLLGLTIQINVTTLE